MQAASVHNPDRYMADLRQILSQGRKRIGLFIGAGAPTAIRLDSGRPLVPDVDRLTEAVIRDLPSQDQRLLEVLTAELGPEANIETILTKVRRLAQAIGDAEVHSLTGRGYETLGARICRSIGSRVSASLPAGEGPYTDIVSWISGTPRAHAVEIFTPNYDLLMEEALERSRFGYFDGFTGSHRPFFDPATVLADSLPATWARLWKLHGSLGWTVENDRLVRTGDRADTELIYPDHLKYDHIARQPYSSLFERLRAFLNTPDTLLLCTGFSFRDYHIRAVLDEALAGNPHTAILAFHYGKLKSGDSVRDLAVRRPNLSVYAADKAIIGGVEGSWQSSGTPIRDWQTIRRTFFDSSAPTESGGFLLGDFAMLAKFLALTQAREFSPSSLAPDPARAASEEVEISAGGPRA